MDQGGGGEGQGRAVGGWSCRPMPRRRIRPPCSPLLPPPPPRTPTPPAYRSAPHQQVCRAVVVVMLAGCRASAPGASRTFLRAWPSSDASVPREPSLTRLQEGRRAARHRRFASGGGRHWWGGGGAGLLSGRALPSSEVDMQFLTLFMWLLMVAAGALRARRERVSAAGARVREGIPPRRSIRAGDTRRRCQAGGQRCAPSQLYLSVCWCTATASPQQRVAAHSRRGRRLCDTAVPPPGLSLAEDVPDKAPPRGTLQ